MKKHKEDDEWKVLIYNGKEMLDYRINFFGKVKSIDRIIINKAGLHQRLTGKEMTIRTNSKNPHLFFDSTVRKNDIKIKRSVYIHKALYETFIGKITKDYVSFKDGDHTNLRPTNLYQITHSELQIRNMFNNPGRRWALQKHNTKSGYYKKLRKMNKDLINRIKLLSMSELNPKQIASKLDTSLSSVYKYR